jgi:hypothetical protein
MIARSRRGTSFIEVLLSLVLLAIAGTTLITLLGQTMHSVENLRGIEAETRAAAAELARFTVVTRSDLVARIGRNKTRGWLITIQQTTPSLFDVDIATSDTGMVLLRTTLYRPDTVGNAQ